MKGDLRYDKSKDQPPETDTGLLAWYLRTDRSDPHFPWLEEPRIPLTVLEKRRKGVGWPH